MDFRAFVLSCLNYFWVHCIVFVEADDIDSNVSGAEAATEQANRQLAKAATSQKSGTTIVNPPPFHYTKMCIWATYFHYKPISTYVKWGLLWSLFNSSSALFKLVEYHSVIED